MATWFNVKVRYAKVNEKGKSQKVMNEYLFDAMSFAEAEARAIKELAPFFDSRFEVRSVTKKGISEIFADECGECWYEVKALFISLNERSGKEQRITSKIMVLASNLDEALKRFHLGMKGTVSDYVIAEIKEVPIMDIFPIGDNGNEECEVRIELV